MDNMDNPAPPPHGNNDGEGTKRTMAATTTNPQPPQAARGVEMSSDNGKRQRDSNKGLATTHLPRFAWGQGFFFFFFGFLILLPLAFV
jgi:hypothetical protein